MKRNEPKWKREDARRYCKAKRDEVWEKLQGTQIYTIHNGWMFDYDTKEIIKNGGLAVDDALVKIKPQQYNISDVDVAAKFSYNRSVSGPKNGP